MDTSMLQKVEVARRRVRRSTAIEAVGAEAAIRTGLKLRAAARSGVAVSAVKLELKPAEAMAKAAAASRLLRRG